jgi:uncharacterized circularly permuted ATP-grasp superfamily protein
MTAPTESAFNTVLASLMLALQRRGDVRIEVEAIAGVAKAHERFWRRPDCPQIPSGVSWAQAQRYLNTAPFSNFYTVPHCGTD